MSIIATTAQGVTINVTEIIANTTNAVLASLMPNAITGTGGNNAATPFQDIGYASIGFMIVCTALVMVMTPFVGILYSGLSTQKNGLSSHIITMLVYSVVAVQWVLFGYSLSFAEDSSTAFIGNFKWGGLKGIGSQALPLSAPSIPAILFALYQMQFATITAAIIYGSVVERIRFLPALIFIFVWATVVYDPIAYWVWGARGWLKNLSCLSTTSLSSTPCQVGVMDFAGGGPVEICSGFSALALTMVVGRRRKFAGAHNMVNVNIATAMLFFGWYGFNAGSALSASPRAALAATTTTISAATAALTFTIVDWVANKRVASNAYCTGALAGLVIITPACGFVPAWASLILGVIGGLFCWWCLSWKVSFEDTMEAWPVHGMCGMLGLILTGFFASKEVIASDGTVSAGGAFLDGNWTQVGYQFVAASACAVWAFVVTYILAWGFSLSPSLNLRCDDISEEAGMDKAFMKEVAYEAVGTPCSVTHGHDSGFVVSDDTKVHHVDSSAALIDSAKSEESVDIV